MAAVNDQDTRELLEDTIKFIEMNRRGPRAVPETRLSSTRVCRQHFVHEFNVNWSLLVGKSEHLQPAILSPKRDRSADSRQWCNDIIIEQGPDPCVSVSVFVTSQ